MDLVFADKVANSAVRNQDLERHRTTTSFSARQQRLTENSFKHERKLRANLCLLIGRKDVDDTVDSGRGGVRVQRGERQVSGFSDTQRGLDRFEVAHFADEDDVRVLAQGSAKRGREAVRIGV